MPRTLLIAALSTVAGLAGAGCGDTEGADPEVGDLGYYAPGNDLVLYYGDQGYYPGIVVLGRLDGTAAQRISAMNGSVTATIQASDGAADNAHQRRPWRSSRCRPAGRRGR